jgi:hypothetical protein
MLANSFLWIKLKKDMKDKEKQANNALAGGRARAEKLSPQRRKEIAKNAADARWGKSQEKAFRESEENSKLGVVGGKGQISGGGEAVDGKLPTAIHWGALDLIGTTLPCYVLDNGQRLIGRTAANEMLTGIRNGALERTISVASLKPFLDADLIISQLVPFRVSEIEGLNVSVKGLPADIFIDVCRGFVDALQASYRPPGEGVYTALTDRQKEMAVQASMFLAAVAKVGLDALIDEATGYQEFREKDALEVKLRAYLAEEMRKWEKTFPDELWMEFGRLTNWQGSIHKRPKYWGKLVMELVYEYLDSDVADWLRENAPKPRGGRNYHQWLSSQYGLQKLVQHIWQVIGMAKACKTMPELKQRMAETFGDAPIQLTITLSRGVEGEAAKGKS